MIFSGITVFWSSRLHAQLERSPVWTDFTWSLRTQSGSHLLAGPPSDL
jgi:hypothetical protein